MRRVCSLEIIGVPALEMGIKPPQTNVEDFFSLLTQLSNNETVPLNACFSSDWAIFIVFKYLELLGYYNTRQPEGNGTNMH